MDISTPTFVRLPRFRIERPTRTITPSGLAPVERMESVASREERVDDEAIADGEWGDRAKVGHHHRALEAGVRERHLAELAVLLAHPRDPVFDVGKGQHLLQALLAQAESTRWKYSWKAPSPVRGSRV